MYGAECWTLSRTNEKTVDVLERKILRRIYDPSKDRGAGLRRNFMTFLKSPDSPWQSEFQGRGGLVNLQEWMRELYA
jgi:hypothetical protein